MKKIIHIVFLIGLTAIIGTLFYQNQKLSEKNDKYKEFYEITKSIREGQGKVEEMRAPAHFYVHTESDFYLETLEAKDVEFKDILVEINKNALDKEKYKEILLRIEADYKILQSDLEDLKESEQKKITINLVDTSISLVCSDFRSILNWIETDAETDTME